MGSVIAKCIPASSRSLVADIIPDRELLFDIAERLASFEEDLKRLGPEGQAAVERAKSKRS